MSHRRIKTLGAPVQSSGERKVSLGVLSRGGGCRGTFFLGLPCQKEKEESPHGQLSLRGLLKWSQLTISSWL